MLFHAEPVLRDGKPVGYVRAASYGHTLGGAVGLAMVEGAEAVDKAWIEGADWQVEVAGRLLPGPGVAAPALRPDEREDQGLTTWKCQGSSKPELGACAELPDLSSR